MTPRFFERKSRSDCVHEQVAKLGPVSRAAGMDCECPLYMIYTKKQQPRFGINFCLNRYRCFSFSLFMTAAANLPNLYHSPFAPNNIII